MPKCVSLRVLFCLSIMKIVNHILHNGSKAETSQVLKKGKGKLIQHFKSNDKFERIVIPIMLLFTF